MMLPFKELVAKYNMAIRGVVHVGARLGEEAPLYDAAGVRRVWWIEGNPRIIQRLTRNVGMYGHSVIEALVTDTDGAIIDFHVTNHDGMSSSILGFGTHPTFSPDTVFVEHLRLSTSTLDTLVARHRITDCNMLMMDLQGAELLCLKGASNFLRGVDYIISEVNSAEVYVGCAKVHELDEHLAGFERVETHWVRDQGWGDALYIRKPPVVQPSEATALDVAANAPMETVAPSAKPFGVHVLVPSYNCSEWIERALGSVASQETRAASVLVLDDASVQEGYSRKALDFCQSMGFGYLRNPLNRKCPYNLWLGIKVMDPAPEDVIFLLDGDDFLPHERVLTRIAEVYSDPRVWLTYGNYQPHPHNTGQAVASAYPPEVIAARGFRHHTVSCYNHPLTFRRKLWDQIEPADLQKSNGEWFTGGYDMVIMFPMLEMTAPDHFQFLDETLYGYNAVNPLSDTFVNVNRVEESREVHNRPMKPRVSL
jgi:FkbM family methyltransferase